MGCIKVETRDLREQAYSLFYVLFKSIQYVLHVYKCVVKERANIQRGVLPGSRWLFQ